MSILGKREFREMDNYFTLISKKENTTQGHVCHTPQESPCEVVLLSELAKYLRKLYYDPEFFPPDDVYNEQLCKINPLSEITELGTHSVVTKFEILESYDLNIETLVNLEINEITMLFNILTYAASSDRFRDFQIWLKADTFELNPQSLTNANSEDKQPLIDTIRMVIMLAVNNTSMEVLKCLCSCPIIYEQFGKTVVYFASVLGKVKVLDWMYQFAKQNLLKFEYEYYCIDGCCKRGHVEVLQWFITKAILDKDFKILYTTDAMDTATLYGKTKILQCWKHNKETLETLGYELLYTEEGFNLKNATDLSLFKTENNNLKLEYGSYSFNNFQEFCSESLKELADGEYFTHDYCADVLPFSIEWWNKSGLPIKYSLNTLKQAIYFGSISLLDVLVSTQCFNFKESLSALPEDEFQQYSTAVVDMIKKIHLEEYQDSVLYWWFKFAVSAADLANIRYDNITSLLDQYKIRLENGEQFEQITATNIEDYTVGATEYPDDDEWFDSDQFWKDFDE